MGETTTQGRGLFAPGKIVATVGVVKTHSTEAMAEALRRHFAGDWEDCAAYDAQANREALASGARIFGVYATEGHGPPIWIITEADRSSTCLLLPEDY